MSRRIIGTPRRERHSGASLWAFQAMPTNQKTRNGRLEDTFHPKEGLRRGIGEGLQLDETNTMKYKKHGQQTWEICPPVFAKEWAIGVAHSRPKSFLSLFHPPKNSLNTQQDHSD